MDLIKEGLKEKLIRLEDEGKYIVYLNQNRRRNYENPEEKVQAQTFLRLVLIYKYPANRIRHFVSVQMGAETKEADRRAYEAQRRSRLLARQLSLPARLCTYGCSSRHF
jgi:type I restriction enzyme M protein